MSGENGSSFEGMGIDPSDLETERSQEIPTLLSETEPIKQPFGLSISTRDALKNIVEPPLLTACEELYDKNIHTLSSSANKETVGVGFAHIIIDFDTLSQPNQEIGERIGKVSEKNGSRFLDVRIPIDKNNPLTADCNKGQKN